MLYTVVKVLSIAATSGSCSSLEVAPYKDEDLPAAGWFLLGPGTAEGPGCSVVLPLGHTIWQTLWCWKCQ